jgi:3-methylcrotonyl-CoA carboxylase alpha subunit
MNINKILIANRGEIAVRIHKTAHRMGIRTVGIFSEADSDALHTKTVDEAYSIGSNILAESYLNIEKIINIAKQSACDAIHPGYGFLSENPDFTQACADAGLIFIGPNTDAVNKMGNKTEARKIAKEAGLPMTEAITGDMKTLLKAPDSIAFPLLIKAAAGGGGKGMRIVLKESELKEAIETTQREAKNYFGNDSIFIEKFIEHPRHIEIQVLCDTHSNALYLFERECSLQRRHQKIVEEAPSPTLTPELRKKMGEAAVALCKQIKYTNAGTIEFLVDKDLNFYFLEMNTRIQVEHPVTEFITGIDIVEQQIYIAEGKALNLRQDDIIMKGHAIESRIYAEEPTNNFNPSPGFIRLYKEPEIAGIRIDSGLDREAEITGFFDPMISKLISYGTDRDEARLKMIAALEHYAVLGIDTNITYLSALMKDEHYIENSISTTWCDEHTTEIVDKISLEKSNVNHVFPAIAYFTNKLLKKKKSNSVWHQIGYWRVNSSIKCSIENTVCEAAFHRINEKELIITINSIQYSVQKIDSTNSLKLFINDELHTFYISDCSRSTVQVYYKGSIFTIKNETGICIDEEFSLTDNTLGESGNIILSPMHGKVISLSVKPGDSVKKDDTLMIIEAMKMENSIKSPKDGVIKEVFVNLEDKTESGKLLIEFEK